MSFEFKFCVSKAHNLLPKQTSSNTKPIFFPELPPSIHKRGVLDVAILKFW